MRAATAGRPCRIRPRTARSWRRSRRCYARFLPGEMVGYRRDRIHSHASLILTHQTRNTGLTSGFTGTQLDPRAWTGEEGSDQLLSSRRIRISFSNSRMAAANGAAPAGDQAGKALLDVVLHVELAQLRI